MSGEPEHLTRCPGCGVWYIKPDCKLPAVVKPKQHQCATSEELAASVVEPTRISVGASRQESWHEFNRDGPSPAQRALWEEAKREAEVNGPDTSHFAVEFRTACEIEAATEKLKDRRLEPS